MDSRSPKAETVSKFTEAYKGGRSIVFLILVSTIRVSIIVWPGCISLCSLLGSIFDSCVCV